MKRRRALIFVLLIVCLGLAGMTVRQWSASAQSSRTEKPSSNPPPATFDLPPGHPASSSQRQSAIVSINAQLKAFAQGDWAKAATYQSAGLRRNFKTADAFRQAITRGYPQFVNAKNVVFGPAVSEPKGDRLVIPVTLTGQDGVTIRAVYLMVLEGKIYHVDSVGGGLPRAPAPPPNFTPTDVV